MRIKQKSRLNNYCRNISMEAILMNSKINEPLEVSRTIKNQKTFITKSFSFSSKFPAFQDFFTFQRLIHKIINSKTFHKAQQEKKIFPKIPDKEIQCIFLIVPGKGLLIVIFYVLNKIFFYTKLVFFFCYSERFLLHFFLFFLQ